MKYEYDCNLYDTYEEAVEAALSDEVLDSMVVLAEMATRNSRWLLQWAMKQPGFWEEFGEEWDSIREEFLEGLISEVKEDEEDDA